MIPFLTQPSLHLGPLTIHAFGVIVAVAVLAGLSLGTRRFRRMGLDPTMGERLAWWTIIGGFLGAHLFSVAFYFPYKIRENPLVLLKLWEDISSFGSILGGTLGIWLFLRLRAPTTDVPTRWAYVDVVAYAFPVSLMIGRLACTLAHDHPGTVTRSPLGVSLESAAAREYIGRVYAAAGRAADLPAESGLARLAFHDLGWYEFLYLALFVVPVVLWLARQPRTPGTFVAAFITLYMPVRFLLDFLRVSDMRYGPLTPAQWTSAGALFVLPWLLGRIRQNRETARLIRPAFADGSPPRPLSPETADGSEPG